MVLQGVLEALLRLVPRGGHQGLGVVQGDAVQEDIRHDGVGAADEGLAAARTLLEVEPHHRGPLLLLEGLGNFRLSAGPQADGGGGEGAELHEVPAGVAFLPHQAPQAIVRS